MARCFSELESKAEDNRLSTEKKITKSIRNPNLEIEVGRSEKGGPRSRVFGGRTIEVAVQKRITGNFQIPMQAAYWLDELCAERRHRWNFRDRPNGNKEDAEAQKPVDTSQWAHSGLNGCLMHVHENRARHAKDVEAETSTFDVDFNINNKQARRKQENC
ncbi:hypothetical protein GTR04_3147 [Trichophyton interdigitale]|nr:hypothetical protein GY631_0484 [Trichophyton interdigitale]KAG8209491.1 hypothetical protein GTR04_3147 [Trichophyton interdigitale]